ncbi:MAG: cysteine hydrolase [Proteobacteria bacterium]|nr:cysteine hydrolase [Pseudomonadota bacterium]MBU1742625.1 cysteine hydrolase [Pseudomonadota bacterium]
MGRRAIFITDMIHDFVHPEGALYIGPTVHPIVPRIKALAGEVRDEGGLVVYLCDAHQPEDREFERFPPHAVQGTPGARIVDELAPRPGDVVIAKTRYSAFFNTALDEILSREEVDEVVFTGVCTSICVMETLGDWANRDGRAVVYGDAVADFDAAAHEFALKRMETLFGADVR